MNTHNQIFYYPKGEYAPEKRLWNGCPSIQVTGNRLWVSMFTGGRFEPSRHNHNVLMYSDDGGKTWVDPYMVIGCEESASYRAMDSNLWLDPLGRLWFTWERMHFPPDIKDPTYDAMYDEWLKQFFDEDISCWGICCTNPEAEKPVWSEPRFLFAGVLRNKPVVLSNGEWLFPAYMACAVAEYYQYYISRDRGETFEFHQGPRRIDGDPCPYEEPMCVETDLGHLIFLVRTETGFIGRSDSYDYGKTWSQTVNTDMGNPSTRFHISKLGSGKLLLINTPRTQLGDRTGIRAFLSEDGGKTWVYSLTLDERRSTTYPDACQDERGNIWAVYDCQRDNRQEPREGDPTYSDAAKEIVLTRFTEDDIVAGAYVSQTSLSATPIRKVYYDRRIG